MKPFDGTKRSMLRFGAQFDNLMELLEKFKEVDAEMKKTKEHVLAFNFNKPEKTLTEGSVSLYVVGKGIKELNERLSK